MKVISLGSHEEYDNTINLEELLNPSNSFALLTKL